jgi:hypothetical protein
MRNIIFSVFRDCKIVIAKEERKPNCWEKNAAANI